MLKTPRTLWPLLVMRAYACSTFLDGSADRYDFWVADGAYIVSPKLEHKYEVHYWGADVTESSESDLELLHLKPILLPGKMGWNDWP